MALSVPLRGQRHESPVAQFLVVRRHATLSLPMNNLDQTKTQRFQFLHKLYEVTEGNRRSIVSMWELGSALGLDGAQTSTVVDYLAGEGLVEHVAIGGEISLTHHGLKEVERALSAPEEPTTYFPPVVNILHVQSMVGSQIQQGTHESTQSFAWTQQQIDAVREFVSLLKQQLPTVALSPEAQNDASADVSTLEAQLKSSQPKRGIIRESLQSVRTILEGAASDAVASNLLPPLLQLLSSLAQ